MYLHQILLAQAILNQIDNAWSIGTLDRTVWSDAFGVRNVPFAFDSDGILYNHETGTSDNGSAMTSFIETSSLELEANGNSLFLMDKIVPDVTLTSDTNIFLTVKTRKYPNDTDTTKGPFTVTSTTKKVSTRAKGRQMAMEIKSTGTQDEWLLGDFRINTIQDGLR